MAEGLVTYGVGAAVVGFDDAPVAEALDLTTIAIPWQEMVDIIRRRMNGYTGAAAKLIFAPRPVMRASDLGHRENP